MQHIVFAQAQAVIHSFGQFLVSTDAGFFFRCVGSVQSGKAVGHIGIDGIEPIHHVLVDLCNDRILGFVSTDPGCGFFGQRRIQVLHVFADRAAGFHNGAVLYSRIGLQGFFHSGDTVVQRLIAVFASCCFGTDAIIKILCLIADIVQISLACFRCHCIRIGLYLGIESIQVFADRFIRFDVIAFFFSRAVVHALRCRQAGVDLHGIGIFVVRNGFRLVLQSRCAIPQSRISCFTSCHFVVVRSCQGSDTVGCVFVHLLDHCILGFVSPDPGGGFYGQRCIQVLHVLTNGASGFHNSAVLYRSIGLQGFFHSGDTVISRFQLRIQCINIIPYRVGFHNIIPITGRIVVNAFCFHFSGYCYVACRNDIASRNAVGSHLATDFHIFDYLIFIGSHNQISCTGNMQSSTGLLIR